MSVLLLILSIASLLLLVYPYLIYPLILLVLPRKLYPVPAGHRSTTPEKVALVFAAYNEERSLPDKIENIKRIKNSSPNIEVHVYADCCTDGSVEILRRAKDLLTIHEGHTRVGKATGMRLLVESTSADIVIFTDANVILDPNSVARLVSYFEDPLIGTVAGTLHYTNPDDSKVARTGSLYWRLEEWIKRLESETGSTMGADGSIFAMRRALYPIVPPHLLDDMISSMNPLFLGYRVVSAPDVHGYERATVDTRDEFKRKRRIACRAFSTHRHLRPLLRKMSPANRFKYVSHKYLRWFSAAFMLAFCVTAVGAVAMLVGAIEAAVLVALGIALLALALSLDLPLLGTISEIVASIVATGIGVIESIGGRDYQTWTPPASR